MRALSFSNKLMNLDSNICCIAVAFLVACMVCASPGFFLRDRVLGKLLLVAGVVAMTVYHRIAGIIALVAVIALLNHNRGIMEGMEGLLGSGSTPAPISFKSPPEFREKYCLRGVPESAPGKNPEYTYMLSPTMFTDNKGTPEINTEFFSSIDFPSFNTCKGGATITNLCDSACNWTMNPAPTATAVPTAMATAVPPATPAMPPSTSEGFTPMSTFRPHIRTGRQIISNGVVNVKSFAKRLQRQLF